MKELITAFKIESVYSKDEILETYLNTVPFLYNAYGVEMAARTYFGKSADQLDIVESATLVGMLKGNSYYNPVLNPERAVQRRNIVLDRMAQMHMLTPQQLAKLQRQPLRVDFEPQSGQPGLAPHFAVQLRKWLIAWADRNNYDLYSDGLVVRTTLDARLQDMATQALTRQTERLQAIADSAWRGPSGCGLRNDLFRGFIRQTPDYRQARDAGLTDVVALKRLGANRDFMRAVRAQDAGAGRLRRDRSAQRRDPCVGRQPRFRQRAVRSRVAGAAPARLDVRRSSMAPRSRTACGRAIRSWTARCDPDRRARGLAPDRCRAADR